MNLEKYDFIIINSSGGKDSLCAIWEVCRIVKEQNYPIDQIVVSHQDLGQMEWKGTKELVKTQADLFGLKTYYSKRTDINGYEENLLEYVERRGKWPARGQRYCTSDFKRGPGLKVVTRLTRMYRRDYALKVLYVFGFRKSESPDREKKRAVSLNKNASTKLYTRKNKRRYRQRTVTDWLPIHKWSDKKVWKVIKDNKLPYHPAYDLGMPRLSCCFCIFSPMDALVIAGRENPELLDRYIEVENKIGHSFKNGFKIASVKEAIDNNYQPKKVENWVM